MKLVENENKVTYEGKFARKIGNIKEFADEIKQYAYNYKYQIAHFAFVTDEEYDDIANRLMKDRDWQGLGGWNEEGIHQVIAIVSRNRKDMILADPSGHNYIRYVSVVQS